MNRIRLAIPCVIAFSAGLAACGGTSTTTTQPQPQAPAPIATPSVDPRAWSKDACQKANQGEWMEHCQPFDGGVDGGGGPAPGSKSGPGTYSYRSNGVFGQIEIPVDVTDSRVVDFDSYRKDAGAPAVTFAVVTVDNQSGQAVNNWPNVVVVTEDGNQAMFDPVTDYLSDWRDVWSSTGAKGKASNSTTQYNRGVTLNNKIIGGIYPGAKGVRVLASKDSMPSIKSVFIKPQGIIDREVAAEKVG